MKNKFIFLMLVMLHSPTFAETPQQLMSKSQQLIIVTTANVDALTGKMQRYERSSAKKSWHAVGKSVPVVVGKNGLAWDGYFFKTQTMVKKDGDNRTPIGIYELGPVFGFANKNNKNVDYFPLTNNSVCVDDVKSNYYNQLLDSEKVPHKDWTSGEQMYQIPQYKIGSVIQYNSFSAMKRGAGSCIFLHSWKGPAVGTAGCVALSESDLQAVLDWLNSRKNPLVVILPRNAYSTLKITWGLPPNNEN